MFSMPAKVRPAHAAGGEHVGEGALQLLPPRPPLAPGAPDPAPVGVGRHLRGLRRRPRFHVAPHPEAPGASIVAFEW